MLIGSKKFKHKKILKDMMSESTPSLNYRMEKYMLADGAGLKLMGQDSDLELFLYLLTYW